jgi:hypothetical protein
MVALYVAAGAVVGLVLLGLLLRGRPGVGARRGDLQGR